MSINTKPNKNSVLGMSIHNKDNSPLTALDLLIQITELYRANPEAMKQPVCMSSDEEGNQAMHLYQIDITKKGNIILWPAGSHSIEFPG